MSGCGSSLAMWPRVSVVGAHAYRGAGAVDELPDHRPERAIANRTALALAPGGGGDELCAVAYAGLERVSGISAEGEVRGMKGSGLDIT